MPNLRGLSLGNNQLSGQIPESIVNSNLKSITLTSNQFSGVIPVSICNLDIDWELGSNPFLGGFDVSDNQFCPPYPFCIKEYMGEQDVTDCSMEDCAGIPYGDSSEDMCGTCDNDPMNDCIKDCMGTWGGDVFDDDNDGICDGLQGTVDDIDGNVYKTILNNNHEWLSENLNVTHYRNGDEIPLVTTLMGSDTIGTYLNYDNNPVHSETYGRLYSWYAVIDERGICPEGWHIPSEDEWDDLQGNLRECTPGSCPESEYWESPNTGATNSSGFTALPGGYVRNSTFSGMGTEAHFWIEVSEGSGASHGKRKILYNHPGVGVYGSSTPHGASVRCLKDY